MRRKTAILSGLVTLAVLAAGAAMAGGLWPVQGAPPSFRGDSRPYIEIQPPRPLPPLQIERPDGPPLGLEAFKGRIVVLNLWATWCAPCVKEMPALDRLQAAFDKRELEVVALSLDRGGAAQVLPFFEETGLKHLSVYLDAKMTTMGLLKPRGLPTTLILDREGHEIGRLEGAAAWDSPAALALMRYYIGLGRPNPGAVKIRG